MSFSYAGEDKKKGVLGNRSVLLMWFLSQLQCTLPVFELGVLSLRDAGRRLFIKQKIRVCTEVMGLKYEPLEGCDTDNNCI